MHQCVMGQCVPSSTPNGGSGGVGGSGGSGGSGGAGAGNGVGGGGGGGGCGCAAPARQRGGTSGAFLLIVALGLLTLKMRE
jgi:hypothetical protein